MGVFSPALNANVELPADLVVLSAGIVADEGNEEISKFLKVPLNQDKFFLEAHMKLRPVDFATEGVFLCGLAHSSKSVDESIIQAQATASRASTVLAVTEVGQTFTFDSAWSGLDRIVIEGDAAALANGIDNIVLTSVPIPAAGWLFGAALAGMGWFRRRTTGLKH